MATDLWSSEGLDPTKSVAGTDLWAPDPSAPGPFKRGLKVGVQDLKSIGGGVLQYAGRATGFGALERTGQEIGEAAAAESAPYRMQVEDVGAAFDRGILPGLGASADLVAYTIGNQIPMLATAAAGGVLGRVAAGAFGATRAMSGLSAAEKAAAVARTRAGIGSATDAAVTGATRSADIGAGLGVGTASTAMELGQIAPEGLKPENNAPLTQIAVGSLISGATDTVIPIYLARKLGLIGAAERVLTPRKAGFGAVAGEAGRTALKVGAGEATQETAQSYIERASANQALTGPEANSEAINSLVMGGIIGLVTGGLAGGVQGMTRPTATSVQPEQAPTEPVQPAAVATPEEQHAAATQAMTDLSAQVDQARAAQTAAGDRLKALAAERKETDFNKRRAYPVIDAERKTIQEEIRKSKETLKTLESQWYAAQKVVTDLTPAISPAETVPADAETALQGEYVAASQAAIVAGDRITAIDAAIAEKGGKVTKELKDQRTAAVAEQKAAQAVVDDLAAKSYRFHQQAPADLLGQQAPAVAAEAPAAEPMIGLEPQIPGTVVEAPVVPVVAPEPTTSEMITAQMREIKVAKPTVSQAEALDEVIAGLNQDRKTPPLGTIGNGTPAMIADALRPQLQAIGYSDDAIANMTPARANEILQTPKLYPVNLTSANEIESIRKTIAENPGITPDQAYAISTIDFSDIQKQVAEENLKSGAVAGAQAAVDPLGRYSPPVSDFISALPPTASERRVGRIESVTQPVVSTVVDMYVGSFVAARQAKVTPEKRAEFAGHLNRVVVPAVVEGLRNSTIESQELGVSRGVYRALRKDPRTRKMLDDGDAKTFAEETAKHVRSGALRWSKTKVPARSTDRVSSALTRPFQVNEANREKTDALQADFKAGGVTVAVTPVSLRHDVAQNVQGREGGGGPRDHFALAEEISRVFGKQVIWVEVEGGVFNGVMNDEGPLRKYVFLNVRSPIPAHIILGHELNHHMKVDAPGVHKALRGSIGGLLRNHAEYRQELNQASITNEEVTDEMIGDLMGDNFGNREFWNRVAQNTKSSSVFRAIANMIMRWIDSVMSKLKTYDFGSERFVTDMKSARKHLAKAIVDYAKIQRGNIGVTSGPVESRAGMDQDTFDNLPEPAKYAAVDEWNRIQMAKGTEIRQELRRILGDDPALVIKTFQATPDSPVGSYTRVDKYKAVIAAALNASDRMSLAAHEGFHYAEDRLLTNIERVIVANAVKEGRPLFKALVERVQRYDRENKTNLTDEVTARPAEARAYAFQFWRLGELQAEGPLQRIFEKIRAVFERIKNLIDGLGFKSVEDIFSALDRGQFAERGGREQYGLEQTERAYVSAAMSEKIKEMAGWTKTRVGRLLSQYAYAMDKNRSKAYAVMMSPDDFLTLTSTERGRGNIVLASKPLDTAKLAAEDQEIYLDVRVAKKNQPDGSPTFVVRGHEGRHRMVALAQAGVLQVPVTLNLREGQQLTSITSAFLAPQNFGAGERGIGGARVNNLVPISYVNQVALEDMGVPAAIQFSKAASIAPLLDSLTPEQRTLYSQAAVEATDEYNRRAAGGELTDMQVRRTANTILENAHVPDDIAVRGFGIAKSEFAGGLKRWWFENIARPELVSRYSTGYRNVMHTLGVYIRYRKILAEQMLRERLPSWYKASDDDRQATFKVMLKRTVERYGRDSAELKKLLEGERINGVQTGGLTVPQLKLFNEATDMIAGFLNAEFAADQIKYKEWYTTPGKYEKWETARHDWVTDMIDKGYVPLKRYGDHTVYIYATDAKGKRISAAYQFFDSPRAAQWAAGAYETEIKRLGVDMKVEVGMRQKNMRETGMSIDQFLGNLERNGVPLQQAAKERLVEALTNTDSIVRNRMMHRDNLPGYSDDSMRVIHEFGVGMASKLAYSAFGRAIDAAASGAQVTADVDYVNSIPKITIGEVHGVDEAGVRNNLWERDGPMSGFYKNISDELNNFVLVPDHSGQWSTRLRAGAMTYFIGGSISGALVNTMSIPMLTVPELSIHTSYINSMTTTMTAWKDAWRYYHVLSDTEKMKDPRVNIPGIDPQLRQAILAASDAIFDTEIHEMLGMSQGTVYSKSRTVQKAMEIWMKPFRISEQTNRLAAFISAYRIASTDPNFKQIDITTGQLTGKIGTLQGQELFKFAHHIVNSTQNSYSEENRPGIARNPFTALLFQFKSFPLFMIEAALLMYKASPAAARNMLLGLVLLTGVQGLPFAETLEDLIDTIAQQIFGSSFNTRKAMINVTKQASEAMVGVDLSELAMWGALNAVAGVSASSRIGSGDFVPGTRLGTADADQGRILAEIAGPSYAMVRDVMTNMGGLFTTDWKEGVDAIRAGGPIALRNLAKGGEQLYDGYASDAKGRKIIDVSTIDGLLQLTGLSSAQLAKAYQYESINLQTKAFYNKVSADMQNALVKAMRDGDTEKVQEISDLRNSWNENNPGMPILPNAAAVRRAIMLAGIPLDRRSQMLWGRRIRGENVFNEQ